MAFEVGLTYKNGVQTKPGSDEHKSQVYDGFPCSDVGCPPSGCHSMHESYQKYHDSLCYLAAAKTGGVIIPSPVSFTKNNL